VYACFDEGEREGERSGKDEELFPEDCGFEVTQNPVFTAKMLYLCR